jgi:hypothetical protein
MPPRFLRLRLLALATAASVAGTAHADASRVLDPVSLWLGGYRASADLSVAASRDPGDVATGKVSLTQGHETIGRARADFVFAGSQGLTFDFYSLSHDTGHLIDAPFSYDGTDYQVGSDLHAKLELSAGSAAYRFWFGSDTDVFGLGLGAAYYRAKLAIEGAAIIDDDVRDVRQRWDESAVAPLLTLGYKHAFSDDLRLYVDSSGVRKNGGALSGHIYDARIGVEWFPWHSVGIGAEYGVSRIELRREKDVYNAGLDIDLDGPSVFARFRF